MLHPGDGLRIVFRQGLLAVGFAHGLVQLEQHAVEQAQQGLGGGFTLGRRHGFFHEIGDGLQPARLAAPDGVHARKQPQHAAGGEGELPGQAGAPAFQVARHVAGHGGFALAGVLQGGAQARKALQRLVFVGRNAQIAHGVAGRQAHAQQKDAGAAIAHVDGQHVVFVFAGLPGGVAQAVAEAGADVAQMALRDGFVSRAQALLDGVGQAAIRPGGCSHAGLLLRHVFHVHDAQLAQLQRQAFALHVQRQAVAHGALQPGRRDVRCAQWKQGQLQARAAVVKTALVDADAFVLDGVVHFHAGLALAAAFLVVNHDVAGKQARHARVVILDGEFLEFNGKRQLLQEHAIRLRQHHGVRCRAFGDHQIAPESRVGGREPVLRPHLRHQPAARID